MTQPFYQPSSSPDAPRLEPGSSADELVLVKGERRFVFACPPGAESALIERLRLMVADRGSGVNWFDAAVVSHEVGQLMSRRRARQPPPTAGRRRSA